VRRGGSAEAAASSSANSLRRWSLSTTIRLPPGRSTRPALADAALASRLRVPKPSLVLHLMQVDYEASGRPVLLSHEYHLADAPEFTVHRKGPR
jgi:hypothetical protein